MPHLADRQTNFLQVKLIFANITPPTKNSKNFAKKAEQKSKTEDKQRCFLKKRKQKFKYFTNASDKKKKNESSTILSFCKRFI